MGTRRKNGPSMMLNSEGFQCCIGQCASQAGIPDELLNGVSTMTNVPHHDGRKLFLSEFSTRRPLLATWVYTCYGINDNSLISDEKREQRLIEVAKSAGHEFVFVD
jgi:hypothetical protein